MQTFNIAVCVTQCRRQGGQRGFAPICELLPTQKNMNLAVFNLFRATFVWRWAIDLAVSL